MRGTERAPKALTAPRSLRAEHEELHQLLEQASHEPGEVGQAAAAVARVLHRHFLKEEQFAMPLLGLLRPLAQYKMPADARAVIELAQGLRAALPQMLQEHRQIVAGLDRLTAAALQEGKPEYVQFADKLKVHTRTEEEVLYPAAILVGEYLKTFLEH